MLQKRLARMMLSSFPSYDISVQIVLHMRYNQRANTRLKVVRNVLFSLAMTDYGARLEYFITCHYTVKKAWQPLTIYQVTHFVSSNAGCVSVYYYLFCAF